MSRSASCASSVPTGIASPFVHLRRPFLKKLVHVSRMYSRRILAGNRPAVNVFLCPPERASSRSPGTPPPHFLVTHAHSVDLKHLTTLLVMRTSTRSRVVGTKALVSREGPRVGSYDWVVPLATGYALRWRLSKRLTSQIRTVAKFA